MNFGYSSFVKYEFVSVYNEYSMGSIIDILKQKNIKNSRSLSFKFYTVYDLSTGWIIESFVQNKEWIREYFENKKSDLIENVDDVYDFLFMYVYGKKFIEFKKEIKIEIDSGRIIFKPEFQSTIEIFFADKLPNELIRQFENLIKNFTNYFQKTENWNLFFINELDDKTLQFNINENISEIIIWLNNREIFKALLESNLPISSMSTFSLIGDINSKTIRKNNPNNFTNLVFTEKYFDKWFKDKYFFHINWHLTNDTFQYINNILLITKNIKNELVEKIKNKIFQSFIEIVNNLENIDFLMSYHILPNIKKFNKAWKIYKNSLKFDEKIRRINILNENKFRKSAKHQIVNQRFTKEEASRYENDIKLFKTKINFSIYDFISQTHELKDFNKKNWLAVITKIFNSKNYSPLDSFSNVFITKEGPIFSDALLPHSILMHFNVQINFLIKFFLDSYSEKDSQLALRRYISSICIQAAKESLITDALEINGIIIDLFTKYFQIRFTKNITKIIYLEFHSILSEVCMIFERFLRNTSHEQINDLFCEYSPQLSSLLDKNKFKIDFIDENERNILEFYFCYRGMKNTQNKIDTWNQKAGYDLRNRTIHYGFYAYDKMEMMSLLDKAIWLFYQTFNSFAIYVVKNSLVC